MKVKKFDFLPFDEWNENRNFKQTIGGYTCFIGIHWCSSNADLYDIFIAAVSKGEDYPYNIWVKKYFFDYLKCNLFDEVTLRQWYEKETFIMNEKLKQLILTEHFENDKD